jgi:hypothetical protein
MTNSVDADINKRTSYVDATGTRIIRWIVGSLTAVASAAFVSARFLH